MRIKLILFSLFIVSLVLYGASQLKVFAAAPTPVVVPVPTGFEEGYECPPLRTGHVSVCGKLNSNVYYEDDNDSQNTGGPLKGVTIAAYLGSRSIGINDVNSTGDYAGMITGLYSYTQSNGDGEFALPIPRGAGTSGLAYLAFLCGEELRELYLIDTTLDLEKMTVALGIEAARSLGDDACSAHYEAGIPAPPYLDYIDREPYTNCSEWSLGGKPGAEPPQPESVSISVFEMDLDDTWVGPFVEESSFQVPAEYELCRRDFEGFTNNWMGYDVYSMSSLNCGLSGCYNTDAADDHGLPSCSDLEKCNTEFPVPAYCKGPGVGLAPPSWDETYLTKLMNHQGAPTNSYRNIEICTGPFGIRTLDDYIELNANNEWVWSAAHRAYDITDELPISVVLNTFADRFLAASFKDIPTNDQYRNFSFSELGSSLPDDCDRNNVPDGEFKREYPISGSTDGYPNISNKPFKSCYKSKFLVEDTYSAQKNAITATGNVFWTLEEYAPVVAAVAAPEEILGETTDLEVNPAIDYEKVGRGYWRLGTPRTLCTGDSAALEVEEGIIVDIAKGPPSNVSTDFPRGNYLDPATDWLREHPSGFKYSTPETRDPCGERDPITGLCNSNANDDGDTFKGEIITEAVRTGDTSDLICHFDVHSTNWNVGVTYTPEKSYANCPYGGATECVSSNGCVNAQVDRRQPPEDCSAVPACLCGGGPTLLPCCTGYYASPNADGTHNCIREPYEYIDMFRYLGGTCDGDLQNYTTRIDSTITNHPIGDSTYGSWLMTSIIEPPLTDCEGDGKCFVGNAYVMDVKAEKELDPLHRQGYGLKLTGQGAPGETYYFDRLRQSLTMNFNPGGPAGDLNESYIIGSTAGSVVSIGCMAEVIGEFINDVMTDPDMANLPHIDFYSPAFNMVSPYTQEMITGVAVNAGSAWGMLDGIAGNIYNLPTSSITGSLALIRSYGYVGNRPILLTETGFYPPNTIDRSVELPRLAAELASAANQNNIVALNLFNAFDSNGDPNFVGHVISQDEFNTVCPSSGSCNNKVGVNSASYFDAGRAVPGGTMVTRAQSHNMGHSVEIANVGTDGSDTSSFDDINSYISGGIMPTVRFGVGDDGGGMCSGSTAGTCDNAATNFKAWVVSLNNNIADNSGGVANVLVGPNEPISEYWIAPQCAGQGTYSTPPPGNLPGPGPVTAFCPNDEDGNPDCQICDTSSKNLFENVSGMSAILGNGANPGTGSIDPVSVDAYARGEAATGVPCAVLAGIHWMEGNNEPNASLISGRAIGRFEPDAGRTFNSLAETAIYAGHLLEGKVAGPFSSWGVPQLVTALSRYNGGGNSQIRAANSPNWSASCPGGGDICSGGTATGCYSQSNIAALGPYSIASSGNPSVCASGWLGIVKPYEGWDDPYAMNYFGSSHINMALQYPADHTHAFEYCRIYPTNPRCPPPIPFTRVGVLPAAIWFNNNNQLGY